MPLRTVAVVSFTSACGAVGVAVRVDGGSDGRRVDCLGDDACVLALRIGGAAGGFTGSAGAGVYVGAIRSDGRTIRGAFGGVAPGCAVVPKPSLASLIRSALLFSCFLSAISSHRIGKTRPLVGMLRYRSVSAPGEASAQIANSVVNGLVLNRLDCLLRPTPRQQAKAPRS